MNISSRFFEKTEDTRRCFNLLGQLADDCLTASGRLSLLKRESWNFLDLLSAQPKNTEGSEDPGKAWKHILSNTHVREYYADLLSFIFLSYG